MRYFENLKYCVMPTTTGSMNGTKEKDTEFMEANFTVF
jgi:hypothetical protein